MIHFQGRQLCQVFLHPSEKGSTLKGRNSLPLVEFTFHKLFIKRQANFVADDILFFFFFFFFFSVKISLDISCDSSAKLMFDR